MKPNIKTTESFYHNLGKLFYAVAFCDKKIAPKEFKTLQVYVEKFWLQYDELTDILGGDAAHLIEIVFEGVQFFNESADDMYQSFVSYKNEQPQLYNEQVSRLILETAKAIAYSYSKLNKSELIILHKLEIELNQL
ncbi:hypothetical protein JCM19314_1836 [Nonlabens ulvanivorans]|uniref:Co-chaperone DjlA N-terminal domain-containing protein n=1 Tax=Nonlabens ulvanivorans TaxID=906888 RepID=A0A090QHF3_NONUL|nr:hypothetical protein [Nonlabens ulvanivorans]GAL01683.1 hypothetical protein JCM19314_1836 [Nonlabens ulvanivorans]